MCTLPRHALGLLACLTFSAVGCASSEPAASTDRPDPTQREEILERDVIVDGVSLLGVWNAVGALDEPDVDSDLRSGLLTETLIINPEGRVTLTGEDRRAETGRRSFEGRISGNRIGFEDLPGEARISVRSDGRIVVTDPRGNRTVYERE